MALTSVIPVRLPPSIDSRLEAVAAATGLSKSELIRRATEDFLIRVRETGQVSYPVAVNEGVANYGSTIGSQSNTFTPAGGAAGARKKKGKQ